MLLRRPTRALATKSCAALALFVATALVVGLGVPVAAARAAWAQAHTLSVSDVTVAEGDSGTVNAEFTVTLSSASTSLVSVDYVTANGTATAGSDYVATTGSLTFTPGQTTRKVPVPVAGDRLDEVNETFTLNLSNAFGATISDGQGVATITDNDPPPSLRVSDANPNPVRESPLLPTLPDNTVTFTVALSGASGKTVTATYATGGGTATAESDYTSATGTLSFAPGETSKTVTVTVLPDAVDEPDETFDLTVSAATEATVADASGRATIADDDGPPALSVADATVVEGDAGTTNAAFTVTLAPASGKTVTVRYATSNGTAAAPGDYATATGTLTFAPGETSKIVTVPVVGDSADEADETFTVTLSGATEALITDATGTGTITDDDAGSTLSIGDVSRLENAGGATTTFSFPVTLSPASGQPVTVDFATADGTATSPLDYAAATGTLTFAAGETSKTVTVVVNGDVTPEPNETFFVNLSNAGNATIADGTATGTIVNDDGAAPTLRISDAAVTEGDTGTTDATFTVTIEPAATQTVTVAYSTADGTATAPGDYAAETGTVSFAAGETSKTITVTVTGDTLNEGDETFVVNLSAALNATIGDGTGIGTITDDDAPPTLAVSDATVTEGDLGTTNAVFTVSLSARSGRAVTVAYATANGTATAGSDYTATSGTLGFAAGETTAVVSVPIIADSLDEADETFTVTLSGATNATIADGTATGTITDDDPPPALSISDVAVTEGSTGTTTATFAVTLSPASGQQVTVSYATADGTATAPADYAAGTGTLTFAAGETTKAVTMGVVADTVDEADETFTVTLSGATNATIADGTATGTITDDDAPPALSVGDTSVNEGDTATTAATFTVSLSSASSQVVTVSYATADGTATAPADYTASSGTLTFAAGETSKTITVAVVGDAVDEADETFSLALSAPTNATVAGAGTATIRDDDGPPGLSIDDVTVVEGSSGTANATFTVSRSGVATEPITVEYATANGTATAPGDYTATSGALTLATTETSKTLTVPVVGDALDEEDETFTVTLSDTPNAVIERRTGRATIGDDDAAPGVSINDVSVQEGSSGTRSALFTVTLSSVSGRAVSVDYTTGDGTATAPGDYDTTAGRLVIAAGLGSGSLSVPVTGDTVVEGNETFIVALSNPVNAVLARANGLATIVDDDQAPPPPAGRSGYWLVARDGGIFAFGDAAFHGSTGAMRLNQPIVGSARTPSGNGYWLVASDGGIFSFGDARFFGSTGAIRLNRPVVGMASTPTGNGYWLVASDGGIFSFGDARFFGSTGAIRLVQPIVGMASTPTGNGYWLVASDGGIFAFGDAAFRGSTGAIRLSRPVVGMAATGTGNGYWLVASDGGIFAFGDARFHGSTGAIRLNQPIVGMASTPTGNGYWLVASDGGIFAFGASFRGSTGAIRLNQPIVAMAEVPR